jgi:uncharacterized protein
LNDQQALRRVTEHELVWIPMGDGTKLAARLWLPENAERDPVPAVLEYIPYRRRDGTRDGDDTMHPWIAERGYACVRLDIRGSGDSEGVIPDEYLKQEQDDAVEAIAWLAAQPWCNGNVGMIGISWGGFNSLQVAARRPPALKAIVTVCSTDDRYADDMHYMGGGVVTDTLAWGTSFFARMACAPDPAMVGEERWRAMWRQRLEASTPIWETWLKHQARDAFWKHGSVCEDFSQIQCAVFAVGGWADGYTNAIFRLLQGLQAPKLGLVGPWGHKYPHGGVPGPAIGFLQECVRWWDHWLKGRDTGIMAEPMLRAWVQDSLPPKTHYDERPGHWAAEPSWPSPNIQPRTLFLNPDGLGEKAARAAPRTVSSPQSTGSAAGEWCPYGLGGLGPELPSDQREEDGRSLVFDSAPLPERLEILGAPVLELEVAADKPNALAVVRLNDVAPDGASLRVTYGVLNLTHRAGHERPRALKPGGRVKVRVQLNDIGHVFPAGHRLRVAISTAYWPILWPSPEPVQLTVTTGRSRIELPVRPPRAEDAQVRFEPAVKGPGTKRTPIRAGRVQRTLDRDIATGTVVNTVIRDDGASTIDVIGTTTEYGKRLVYRIRDDDPTSARAEVEETIRKQRGDWHMRIETRTALACTREAFLIEADLQAFDGDRRFFSRSWTRSVPRRHV